MSKKKLSHRMKTEDNENKSSLYTAGYAILQTACIDPGQGSIKTFRNDPLVRLNDYKNGLRFWLGLPDSRLNKIVFIDNSGYPLDELKTLVDEFNPFGKKVEFISLSCNYYPPGIHYGYAELNMIDEAFKLSDLLNQSEYFIKATGRLTFPGISRLLNCLSSDYIFAVDCRNSSFLRRTRHEFVTTQLMIFSTHFYRENLLEAKSELNAECHSLESLFYRKLIPYKGKDKAILRWKVSVDPVGYAAHRVKSYTSPRQRILNTGRAVCRFLFPSWWV